MATDEHETHGLCKYCGRAIIVRCCGPFEGQWRVPFDAFGDSCSARPDTGPIDHEPKRDVHGVLTDVEIRRHGA
ncbi:hypothetical protein [Microbacterium paludicola]|uniref:hypothetical protein n=1 Tax=Microbacterium paludicola TaxID=300019 RepID=UPI0011A335F1|nr:hypothetical protein [Microbacterium paludicola]